eukprot:3059172-Karenia_brevis.AAC.1
MREVLEFVDVQQYRDKRVPKKVAVRCIKELDCSKTASAEASTQAISQSLILSAAQCEKLGDEVLSKMPLDMLPSEISSRLLGALAESLRCRTSAAAHDWGLSFRALAGASSFCICEFRKGCDRCDRDSA